MRTSGQSDHGNILNVLNACMSVKSSNESFSHSTAINYAHHTKHYPHHPPPPPPPIGNVYPTTPYATTNPNFTHNYANPLQVLLRSASI